MSVGRRLMMSLLTLVACTALLGVVALAGLSGLKHRYRAAEEQYEELRSLYEIGSRVTAVRQVLNAGARDDGAVRLHLVVAAREAEKLTMMRGAAARPDLVTGVATIRSAMDQHLQRLSGSSGVGPDAAGLQADVNSWLGRVASLAAATQDGIIENRREAIAEFQEVLVLIFVVFAATIAVAAAVGVLQYRSVMVPLRALDAAVAQVAARRLGHRINEHGDWEFRRLMRNLNRMSRALDELHASMRQQVEVKSRQLMRSEQLASVGYLAAGLAHEINNPLGIIAGHAQKTLRCVETARSGREREEAMDKAQRTLRIVCEEAFRCRDIALQLLRMAQPVDGEPEVVALEPLARRAIDLVQHLPIARDREVICRCEGSSDELTCSGYPSQVLQVVINLLTNGLEACASPGGRVALTLRPSAGLAVMRVEDNGCGMDGGTLARAFDPFFTDKPRRGLDGCGLGLSISHAIVERHAGRLYADSAGPGRGSTFTIELPLASTSSPRLEHSDAGTA